MNHRIRSRAIAMLFASASWAAQAAPSVVLSTDAQTGSPVAVALSGSTWPTFIPATRYSRSGNVIRIEYEYASDFFGPARPDFGHQPVWLGELLPGKYRIEGRLHDFARPASPPEAFTSTLVISAPQALGAYPVPAQPGARLPWHAVVVSTHYFDPASVRVTADETGPRIDFQFDPNAPVGSAAPPGFVTWQSVPMASLAPGNHVLKAFGAPRSGDGRGMSMMRLVTVRTFNPVVEFYHDGIDHYFIALGRDEIDILDHPLTGWKRTGQAFNAWLHAADAPPEAMPVCRFYASGPNSHFFTADPSECQQIRDLEAIHRAQAAAEGRPFTGWAFEAIGFHALVPRDGQCPWGTTPVWRAYNMRAQYNDTNHRYSTSVEVHVAMTFTGANEGIKFCSPE